jgi:hypothetical protein
MIEIHQQIPGLLANPRAGGMSGHPGHVHLSSAELDEEQDVDPFQPHRINGEEVTRQDAAGLGGKGTASRTARCGGARGRRRPGAARSTPCWPTPVAEPEQLAVDAPMSSGRILGGQAQHQVWDLPGKG